MNLPKSDIPPPSVRRLSVYLRQLESLEASGIATISSQNFAASLGLTAAQVRKDLAYFGQFGRSGLGYGVVPLIHRIRKILGTDRLTHALLVGVGNLGKALAAYQGFAPKGFGLVAIFDLDHRKIGKKIGGLTIEPLDRVEEIVKRYAIRLAILAVPVEAAQAVADRLTAAGVRGILNFAPLPLATPPGVTVRNIDVAAELEQLNFLSAP